MDERQGDLSGLPEAGPYRWVAPATALLVWFAYCTGLTVLVASDQFEVTVFFAFVPAHVLMGFFVDDGRAALLPPLLTVALGWLAFEAACPCYEDGIAFFYGLWTVLFALPGLVLVPLGALLRRTFRSACRSRS